MTVLSKRIITSTQEFDLQIMDLDPPRGFGPALEVFDKFTDHHHSTLAPWNRDPDVFAVQKNSSFQHTGISAGSVKYIQKTSIFQAAPVVDGVVTVQDIKVVTTSWIPNLDGDFGSFQVSRAKMARLE